MTDEETCPICKAKLETWHDTLDSWCLLEDYAGCPNHCYSYYYFTGTTEIQVKDKKFSYYHTATQEEKNRIQNEADEYIKSFLEATTTPR